MASRCSKYSIAQDGTKHCPFRNRVAEIVISVASVELRMSALDWQDSDGYVPMELSHRQSVASNMLLLYLSRRPDLTRSSEVLSGVLWDTCLAGEDMLTVPENYDCNRYLKVELLHNA